ncbi:MAG: hypothetical protein DI534_06745 [Leifsonia xyli]|nr:MAG: hypothetical protein DI534_06745 [Leifsonia xyli]
MPRRTPLDPALGDAFRVGEARAAGFSASRLRGADLLRPHRGVRMRGAAREEHPLVAAARAYAPLLRAGDRFSGSIAAALWGAPLPRGLSALHVTAGPGLTRPRRRGVVGHEGGPDGAVLRDGLPASSPIRAFLECAVELELDDLVAVGDHLVLDPRVLDPHDLRPYCGLDELRREVAAASGRGIRRARLAAVLVRAGAESRRETKLRLLAREAGFPEPECGMLVHDAAGRPIGWFDLVWPAERVIVEYDGDQHRTSTYQYDRDIRRFDRAVEAGYRVVRVRARGLGPDREETVERIRRAFAR